MHDFEDWLLEQQLWTKDLDPRNYGLYLSRIFKVATEQKYEPIPLGDVHGYPLFLFKSTNKGPRILVTSGMHGEEPAGPWGLLKWLEDNGQDGVALSFIPVVNPTGFCKGRRKNQEKEVPNRGYIHKVKDGYEGKTSGEVQMDASKEDKVLKGKLPLLKEVGKDGFLSLHEDCEVSKFFLFTYSDSERDGDPEDCAKKLRAIGGRVFGLMKKDPRVPTLKDGMVLNDHDGSLEDALFHLGVPHCFVTETPSNKSFLRRVEANRRLVEAFCRWTKEHGSGDTSKPDRAAKKI